MSFVLDVDPIFLMGFIVFLGYFSILLFEKKRISQIISLILVGIIIGPLLGIIDVGPNSSIVKASPFLASIALILLLFDGGLNLNLLRIAKEFPRAMSFTIILFILSSVGTGFLMQYLLNWDFIYGLLLGVMLGGTSSAVIITVVEKSKISGNVKTFLTLESTITDVLVVIVFTIILGFVLKGTVDVKVALMLITSAFSTSIIFGFVFAIIWIYLLNNLEDKSFMYILTISFALVLYSLSNFLGGNGNFTVFVFALVLGNIKILQNYIKHSFLEELALSSRIRTFQEEITFFIRTFFFVYMGLIVPINTILNPLILSTILILTMFYLVLRFLIVKFFVIGARKDEKFVMTTSMGRGLAAAVVASIAVSKGLNIPGIIEMVIGVILFSNLITTWGLYSHYDYIKKKEEEKEEKGQSKSSKKIKNNKSKIKSPTLFIDWIFR